MVYKFNFPNGTSGLDYTLKGISTQQSLPFVPLLLLFVWGTVFLGGFVLQSRRTGRGDGPMWAMFASLSVFLISLILTIKTGYLEASVLGVVIAINIVSAFWLFLSRGANEL